LTLYLAYISIGSLLAHPLSFNCSILLGFVSSLAERLYVATSGADTSLPTAPHSLSVFHAGFQSLRLFQLQNNPHKSE